LFSSIDFFASSFSRRAFSTITGGMMKKGEREKGEKGGGIEREKREEG